MKVKTSLMLSEDLVRAIDEVAAHDGSRSSVVEGLVREAFARRREDAAREREIAIMNAIADADTRGELATDENGAVAWWELGDPFTEDDLVDAAR